MTSLMKAAHKTNIFEYEQLSWDIFIEFVERPIIFVPIVTTMNLIKFIV